MSAEGGLRLPIRSDADLAAVRQHVREAAARAGFGLVKQTKTVTAASELARNTLVHGGGGHMEMDQIVRRDGVSGLQLRFVDTGPGIPEVDLALTDGWSSGGGLGLGLGGSRRLVDDFAIESSPGQGTTVTISCWAPARTPSGTAL